MTFGRSGNDDVLAALHSVGARRQVPVPCAVRLMLDRTKRYACPCCGAVIDQPLGYQGHAYFGPCQQRLYDIVRSCPEGISADGLRDRLYGASERNHHLIYVMIYQLNKKLKRFGLKISGIHGRVYRLYENGPL